MTRTIALFLTASAIGAAPAMASDTTYVDPCIDAVAAANGADAPKGGEVLSQQYSEAGTLVMLRDGQGQTWRCISYKDGTVGELTLTDSAENMADDGNGAMSGAQNTPSNRTERVSFAPGTSGAVVTTTLGSGDAVTYVLGAGDGQFLDVQLQTSNPNLYFMIYVPDGDILYESAQAGNSYRGQLYESGDHRVEVFYNGDVGTTADAKVTFTIE